MLNVAQSFYLAVHGCVCTAKFDEVNQPLGIELLGVLQALRRFAVRGWWHAAVYNFDDGAGESPDTGQRLVPPAQEMPSIVVVGIELDGAFSRLLDLGRREDLVPHS